MHDILNDGGSDRRNYRYVIGDQRSIAIADAGVVVP